MISIDVYGTTCIGGDDAIVINAGISDIAANGGGILFLPKGVYNLATTVTLHNMVILQGDGFARTILRAADGTSHVVMETDGFTSLAGTNSALGPLGFGLRDLSIDGNKANRTGSETLLRVYGYEYELTNVEIYQGPGTGFYSEWAISGNVPVTPFGTDTMESHITGLKVFKCAVDGLVFNGPHDTVFRDILTFINNRHGAVFGEGPYYTAGGTMVDQLHSYGNAGWGVVTSTALLVGLIESESNATGGIQVNLPGGRFVGGTIFGWANTGPGVELNAPSSSTSVVVDRNGSDGLRVYSKNNQLTIRSSANLGAGVTYGGSASGNVVVSCHSTGNLGKGVYLQSNDNRLSGLTAIGNAGGGLEISSGVGGIRVDGECAANSGIQAALGVLGVPAMIDLLIYTNPGQTAWSGTPGNNFVRIASRGADTHPYNSVQT